MIKITVAIILAIYFFNLIPLYAGETSKDDKKTIEINTTKIKKDIGKVADKTGKGLKEAAEKTGKALEKAGKKIKEHMLIEKDK